LNIFLKKYAYQNQYQYFVGVTYVIHENIRVIGYITISASSIKKVSLDVKKTYDDIPVLRIGRLAVDRKYQGKRIDERLLKFGIEKALELKEHYGCVGIVVDAKEDAIDFYQPTTENTPSKSQHSDWVEMRGRQPIGWYQYT